MLPLEYLAQKMMMGTRNGDILQSELFYMLKRLVKKIIHMLMLAYILAALDKNIVWSVMEVFI